MSDPRWAFLLFSASFLVRLVCRLGCAIFGTDSCHYLLMADWMHAGRFHDALSIAYHPMYPLLIAAAKVVLPATENAGSAVAMLLGAGATVPLFWMVKDVFGRPTAVVASLMYVFHPAIVEVQSDPMTEGAFLFFLFSTMWLTWRMLQEPGLARGAVLGAAAAAAFLTRPEGLLAIVLSVAWPVVYGICRKDRIPRRLAGAAAVLVVIVLSLSPYLLWVKSVRGRWAMSVRPSMISAERNVGLSEMPGEEEPGAVKRRYGLYGLALLRLTMYGLLVPFYAVGFASLKRLGFWPTLFYLSFPLGQFGGILWALGTHNFMSDRYLMAGSALMAAVAAHGLVVLAAEAARRWPEARWRPALCGVALFLITVAPCGRVFKVRRTELLGYPGAAAFLTAHAAGPVSVSGLEQVSYYCNSRSYYIPSDRAEFERFLKTDRPNYLAYSEKDAKQRPEYVAMLRSHSIDGAPLEYQGPPGTWKVYFVQVR